MEIERKFLLNSLPEDFDSCLHREMEQGYLITDGCTLRIRKSDDTCYLTLKQKPGGHEGSVIVNEEFETEIPEESYEALKKLVKGGFVKKTRTEIPYLDHVIEVDVFHGNLEGLIFAEIEYTDGKDALTLPLPVWFSKDVSEDHRFRNTRLSEMTRRDALRLLEEISERGSLVL
ncbi:MAG: adenylate cyclase [Lachnospiraceae bacterium]|nr:adenylate cyclase [Lachnospiraceae bacterium]